MYVLQWFPKQLVDLNKKVVENQNNLWFFMLFLRTTPLFPNVLVNLGAPIVGIPLHVFAIGTFFGLMPANFVHITTGMEV